jgi:hypothetical protein
MTFYVFGELDTEAVFECALDTARSQVRRGQLLSFTQSPKHIADYYILPGRPFRVGSRMAAKNCTARSQKKSQKCFAAPFANCAVSVIHESIQFVCYIPVQYQ